MRRAVAWLAVLLACGTADVSAQLRPRIGQVDPHPLQVFIYTPTRDAAWPTSEAADTIAGAAYGTDLVSVTWAGTGAACSGLSGTADGVAIWQFTVTYAGFGTCTLTVTVTDGLAATATDVLTITRTDDEAGNGTPPTVAISTSGGADFDTTTQTIALDWLAEDNVAVSSMALTVRTSTCDGAITATGSVDAFSAAASVSGHGTINLPAEGANLVCVCVDDAAANGPSCDSTTVTYDPPLTITTQSLGACIAGTAFSTAQGTLLTTGGTGSKTFTVSAGTIIPGLSLGASTGVITGTPTDPDALGAYDFTVQVTDSDSPAETDTQRFQGSCVTPGSGPHAYFQTLTDTGTYQNCGGAVTSNCRVQFTKCTTAGENGGCSLRNAAQLLNLMQRDDYAIRSHSSSGGVTTLRVDGHPNCFAGAKTTIAGNPTLNGDHVMTALVEDELQIAFITGGTNTPTVTTTTNLTANYTNGSWVKLFTPGENKTDGYFTISNVTANSFQINVAGDPTKIPTITGDASTRVILADAFTIAGTFSSGSGGTANCWHWEYDFARDANSYKQDAAKMTLPPSQASNPHAGSFVAPETYTDGSFLVVMDAFYGPDLRMTQCGGHQNDGDWKSHMTSEGERYFETRNSWSEGMIAGDACTDASRSKVGAASLRTYTTTSSPDNHHLNPSAEGPGASAWGLTSSGGNSITPTGRGAVAVNGYQFTMQTWYRWILLVEINVRYDDARLNHWKTNCNDAGGPTSGQSCANLPTGTDPGTLADWDFHLYTLWICEENGTCARVYYRMPWYGDLGFSRLWQMRLNTSGKEYNRTGTIDMYFRNVIGLRNPTLDLTGNTAAEDMANNPTIFATPVR